MNSIVRPDFSRSIVNLMSNVYGACGWRQSIYRPLSILDDHQLEKTNNLILFVIDGLGKYFVDKYGKSDGILSKFRIDNITSVFPSTTSAALTSFTTGLAPKQHAVTGWFMYLAETGCVSAVLPFKPRIGGSTFSDLGVAMKDVLGLGSIYGQLQRDTYVVNQEGIIYSDFSSLTTKGSQRIAYQRFPDCLKHVSSIVRSHDQAKYIYSYWPEFDGLCHIYGGDSKNAERHYEELERNLEKFLDEISGTNTTVILTADHGLIDTVPEKIIGMEEHPVLQDCLVLPLCGEPRAAYCYVKPNKINIFEEYLGNELSHALTWHTSESMVAEGYFGNGEENRKLMSRIGDYIVLMKDNFVIKDRIAGEGPFCQVGVHGGMSAQEMEVPLIVIKP